MSRSNMCHFLVGKLQESVLYSLPPEMCISDVPDGGAALRLSPWWGQYEAYFPIMDINMDRPWGHYAKWN